MEIIWRITRCKDPMAAARRTDLRVATIVKKKLTFICLDLPNNTSILQIASILIRTLILIAQIKASCINFVRT